MIYSVNYILNHKSVTLLRYVRTCAFLSTQAFSSSFPGCKAETLLPCIIFTHFTKIFNFYSYPDIITLSIWGFLPFSGSMEIKHWRQMGLHRFRIQNFMSIVVSTLQNVKHNQELPKNCLSVFCNFVGLALEGLIEDFL